MAGLVNSAVQPSMAAAPAATAPTEIPKDVAAKGSALKNPILNQVETQVEAKINPKYQQMYTSIINAAMDLAFNQKTTSQMQKGLQSSPDIYKNVSLVCAGMMGVIYEQAKQDPNMFLPAAMSASIVLMAQLLEFAEGTGLIKIDDQGVAKCTSDTAQAVMKKFGIDDSKIKQVQAASTQQPAAAQQPQGAM